MLFPQDRLLIITVLTVSNIFIAAGLYFSTAQAVKKSNPFVMASTLQIANETLPHLRRGLNEESARHTAEIIQKITEVGAVAITDRERVLAYLGAGCEKHHPGDLILTEATKEVINTGQPKLVNSSVQLNCPEAANDCKCPLKKAVIVPLTFKDQVVGSLKLYQTEGGQLPPHVIRLAKGVAQLLSIQIELAEFDRQSQLVTEARLESLHAQINPHFLFNTLNTIIAYSRMDSSKTRQLLIHLADFFRHSLRKHGSLISLREELEYVNTYLFLEEARFGDKLKVVEQIMPELLNHQVPVLSLQPLVENAVKHGISKKIEGGTIKIIARKERDHMIIMVKDNGMGVPAEQLEHIFTPGYGSGNGVGLSNVNERLQVLYGKEYGIRFASVEGKGTTVIMRIPLTKLNAEQNEGRSFSQ
jgi:two-component system LytT family sensor kinase